MKLILAQGNPGSKYTSTRHNVGFYLLDKYAEQHSGSFIEKSKFHTEIAEVNIEGEKVILAKPTTFYNETGRSARALIDFYKIDPTKDLLVIHDDIALPFGALRTREKGSDAGNNGIKSLNSHLGSSYFRLRVGIYSDKRDQMHDADFVLSNFSATERHIIDKEIVPIVTQIIDDFITESLEATSWKLTERQQ